MREPFKVFKAHYLFIILLFILILFRFYRLDILTTFGRDQGIDFLTVRDDVQDYPSTQHLYVVADSQDKIFNSPPWEIYSMAPFKIGQSWQINKGVILFRLDKISHS